MNKNLLPNIRIVDLNVIKDAYIKNRIRKLLFSKSVVELEIFINKIYEEGFNDGFEEGQNNP